MKNSLTPQIAPQLANDDDDRRVRTSHRVMTFRIAAISSNTNAFGLRGVVLVSRSGVAFSAATYIHPGWGLAVGNDVFLRIVAPKAPKDSINRYHWVTLGGRVFEIPCPLPKAPRPVVRSLFPARRSK
jgi:hypothetical protein